MLLRQLSSYEPDGAVYAACMTQARDHAKMLDSVGLDFKNLVGKQVEQSSVTRGPIGLGLS